MLCSDDRAVNDQHRCDKPVDNTVDVDKATYTNDIGDALMLAYWQDPAFDPKQRAFYYVRVLDHLRRGLLRHCTSRGRRPDPTGARLHVAHLVHAG